ncbi:hypothetical protein AVEN_34192-1 [Araneus ventricosus]|uniref:Uncharacterized protein n=1 Tax=Araneus ventricosus TaxID=182803 RepID=A0A4Y2GJQ7_ARAVE|nr:hypothetical protein AVEN_34192-1 [Araneus ventricosus]
MNLETRHISLSVDNTPDDIVPACVLRHPGKSDPRGRSPSSPLTRNPVAKAGHHTPRQHSQVDVAEWPRSCCTLCRY